jgi:hypothetical protein
MRTTSSTRRLVVGAIALLSLAACGSDTGASVVADTTGGSAAVTTIADTTDTAPVDTTGSSAAATGDTVAATDDSVAADSTVAGSPATSTVPSATVTTVAGTATTLAPSTATTAAPTATTRPPTITPTPAPTTKPAPTTTRPPVTTAPAAPGSSTFSVSAEDPTPPVYRVALGTDVTLNITSAIDQEFHVHDIDLTLGGTFVRFRFTADLAGTHIVESHDTGKLICTFVIG